MRPGRNLPNPVSGKPLNRIPGKGLKKTPLRVLFVKDTLGKAGGVVTGGVTYFFETLRNIDRRKIEPMLCILRPRDSVATRFEEVGIYPIFLSRGRWDPRALIDLLRLLREREVDILHLEGKKSLIVGRIAARITKHPAIVHLHDTYPVSFFVRFLIRRLAPWTDRALAISKVVRNRGVQEFAIPPDRIEVLQNGHDIDRFSNPSPDARRQIRKKLGLSEETPIIGLIGRIITWIKGQELMIRAMPSLLEYNPHTTLLIVGDGPDLQACQTLVRQLRLDKAVLFTGKRDDIPDLLAALDFVAMPSLYEGFGYVALEAAAAGKPVVAFDTEGISEVVVHGETGLLVSKGDVGAFTKALREVLMDKDLVKVLGEGGRRHAKNFSMDRHLQKLEEVYASVMTSHCSSE